VSDHGEKIFCNGALLRSTLHITSTPGPATYRTPWAFSECICSALLKSEDCRWNMMCPLALCVAGSVLCCSMPLLQFGPDSIILVHTWRSTNQVSHPDSISVWHTAYQDPRSRTACVTQCPQVSPHRVHLTGHEVLSAATQDTRVTPSRGTNKTRTPAPCVTALVVVAKRPELENAEAGRRIPLPTTIRGDLHLDC